MGAGEINMAPYIFVLSLVFAVTLATSPMLVDDDCKPTPKCPKNEVYTCRNPCPPNTCASRFIKYACIANQTCVNQCVCKEGYLRTNANGTCIPSDQCLPQECANDENAVKGNGKKCRKTCTNCKDGDSVSDSLDKCQLNTCDCKPGYVYDKNVDKCVKPKDCTQQCTKPHERYSSCLLGECVAKTCDDLGKPIACPAIAPPCAGGCICEDGYVRDCKGVCIDKLKCPSCGGDENAQSGCGNPCGKTCDVLYQNKSAIVCPLYCEVNGCDCKEGYLLNTETKKCTLIKDCPKPKCGDNEEFICGPDCPEVPSCDNPKPPVCINKKCKNACYCKDGFVRDANNKCIPVDKCPPKCTKPHERYSNCLLGECVPKTCDDLGKPIPCPKIAPPCAGGCICEDGYVRDCNGVCIDKLKCPSCGGDENAQSGCGNPCGKTCDSLYQNKSAIVCPQYCEVNGCDCKKGYLLNTDTKKCTLIKDCPKPKCGDNEEYICGPDCPEVPSCDNPKPPPCANIKCKDACYCKDGFVRDANKKCIPIAKCPQNSCSANETWVTCNVKCPTDYCPKDDKPKPVCDPLKDCPPGCRCKLNYKRNEAGKCILITDCPPGKCSCENEVWDSCPSACLAEGCDDIDKKPSQCNTLILNCQPKCVCKKGHYRNKDLKCVPAAECPIKCTKPHEKYIDCLAGQCNPKSCEELIKSAPCPKVIGPCPGGCICEDGYLWDAQGNCIKKEECPTKECKGPNEKWTDCAAAQCTPITCDDLGKPSVCPLLKPGYCAGGCICEKGFVRNSKNVCVAIKDCPTPTCANVNQTWASCGVNCPDAYCPKDDKPQPVCSIPYPCEPGCRCKPNYKINKDNNCILACECPPVKCTRCNEVWSSCPPADLIENCADRGSCSRPPVKGPTYCNPRCICKKNYYKNKDGVCVPECECPK